MDVEKTMQFILEMQARHEAAIQQLDERLYRVSALAEANTTRISQLVGVCASLANLGEETDRRIRELRDAQAHSDYKLNALIETVDKLTRHNGSQH
jgi:hypothetical protein